jgi:hypothetical protein
MKNLQNRVKSVESQQQQNMQGAGTFSNLQSNNSFSNHHNFHNHPQILPSSLQDTFNTLPIQTQHQIINQILSTTALTDTTKGNNSHIQPSLPSLPLAPPPSLASALYAQHQYQHQQQQQQLLDDLIQHTLARGHQQPSPVQYNSPWNVNLEANHSAPSNNGFMQRLGGNNRNHPKDLNLLSSTFTAQQYANRTLNNKLHLSQQQQQQQQDYSSISPVDEINDEYNNYSHEKPPTQQYQHLILNTSHLFSPNPSKTNEILNNKEIAKETWACNSVNDTNSISNPVSSNSLTNSSNSSNLSSKRSSRSGDDIPSLVSQYQQHYANQSQIASDIIKQSNVEKLNDVDMIVNRNDQIFISELVRKKHYFLLWYNNK